MAGPLQIDRAGGWHPLIRGGNGRRAGFRDDRDRAEFRELLGELGDWKAVSVAIRPFEGRLRRPPPGPTLRRRVCQMSKVEL
jgi:hypothetical protein